MKTKSKFSIAELAEKMSYLTCELARTCNEKENHFASMFNLTPAEFKCLRLFKDSKTLTIKDITKKVALTPGRITHILTSLEAKKFVVRRIDEADKRNVIVDLTPKSAPFIQNLNASHVKLHDEIIRKIKPDMRETVLISMEKVIDALNNWNEEFVSQKTAGKAKTKKSTAKTKKTSKKKTTRSKK